MRLRVIGLWVLLIVLFVAFYQVFQHTEDDVRHISFTELLDDVHEGKVAELRIRGTRYSGTLAGTGERFRTTGPVADTALLTSMHDFGVDVVVAPAEEGSLWLSLLGQWLPVCFLFLFFVFLMRQLKGGAKLPQQKLEVQVLGDPGPLRGLDEARARLRSVTDALKSGRPDARRVLLSGGPGTGKTALVKAMAADSGLKAFVAAGSDFVEMFVGVGAKRVRDLFEAAAKVQPVMVVIEDLDAIAKTRAPNTVDAQQGERDQTLIELCQWLDGLKKFPERVLLVATTNRLELLDPAIVRPGRFELHVKLVPNGAMVEG